MKKGLKHVIDSFEKAKEWADLSNCLQKVKKHIENNTGLEIPWKIELAKRLGNIRTSILNINSLMFEP